MTKKFAIVLALFLIAVVCSAGCIDPETPVDPVVPADPIVITLRDVLEGLVGMIKDQTDDPQISPFNNSSNEFIVDGQFKWYDFLSYFEAEDLYKPSSFSTVAGWFLDTYRRLPSEGESVVWHDFHFKILDMDGARIDKFIVSRSNENNN